jgi:hypothetical protein
MRALSAKLLRRTEPRAQIRTGCLQICDEARKRKLSVDLGVRTAERVAVMGGEKRSSGFKYIR